jgi:hypothetical protein
MADRNGRYSSNADFAAMVRRMLRAMARRAAVADPEDLAMLIEMRADLDTAIADAVAGLRASGFTWESISEATGTTRQAACQRWGRSARSHRA